MDWRRCANKRRKRAASRPMEPHLGDIPDMDMPPMTLHRPRAPGDAVDKIKAVLFTLAGFILLGAALFAIFMFAMMAASTRSHGGDKIIDPHEKEVISDCSGDALRFCKLAIPRGRGKIIDCMQSNKAKLQAKCSRHLW